MRWLLHIIRWVLMTPLGRPVEPEVNRNLAMVPGVTRSCAASTAAPAGVSSSARNSVAGLPGGASAVTTSSVPAGTVAAIARPNSAPLAANTRPGSSRPMMWPSLSKSFDTSEYGTEIGA